MKIATTTFVSMALATSFLCLTACNANTNLPANNRAASRQGTSSTNGNIGDARTITNQPVGHRESPGQVTSSTNKSDGGARTIDAVKTPTQSQQFNEVYTALRSIPVAAKDYVNAYMQAISSRSGLLARAYVTSTLQKDIPSDIGATRWIAQWTVSEPSVTKMSQNVWQYKFPVSASALLPGGKSSHVFSGTITLQTHGGYQPFIITAQNFTFASGWGQKGSTSTLPGTNSNVAPRITDIYAALQSVPKTPSAYVQAYMQALSTRSGPLTRAYLSPSIRNQVPARTIGSSRWISRFAISEPTITQGKVTKYKFQVTASTVASNAKGQVEPTNIFHGTITVTSQFPNGGPPYITTEQALKFTPGWSF